jgi:hypothetical protein
MPARTWPRRASFAGVSRSSAALGLAVLLGGCGRVVIGPGRAGAPPTAVLRPGNRPLVGVEYAAYALTGDEHQENYYDGSCVGLRYTRTLSLRAAVTASAGYCRYRSSVHAEAVVRFPVRLQLELGSYLGATLSRWYVSVGGGFYASEKFPSEGREGEWPEVPYVDSEWGPHVALGLEFRNETMSVFTMELGHVWLDESGADSLVVVAAIGYQF